MERYLEIFVLCRFWNFKSEESEKWSTFHDLIFIKKGKKRLKIDENAESSAWCEGFYVNILENWVFLSPRQSRAFLKCSKCGPHFPSINYLTKFDINPWFDFETILFLRAGRSNLFASSYHFRSSNNTPSSTIMPIHEIPKIIAS